MKKERIMPDELNKKNENESFNPFDFGEVLHRKEYIILLIIFSLINIIK